jgi:hypothetical protein
MNSLTHGACITIAYWAFYGAVFVRVLLPGGPAIVYITIGALLFIICVLRRSARMHTEL